MYHRFCLYPVLADRCHPARHCTAQCQAGFTLIELLVVVVIIGIILTFANLNVGGDAEQIVRKEAGRLEALLDLARQHAVLQGRDLAVQIRENDYEFLVLEKDQWVKLEGDDILRPRYLPNGLEFELLIEGEAVDLTESQSEKQQLIFILSSGEMTPFELTLKSFIADGVSYQLVGDAFGEIEIRS